MTARHRHRRATRTTKVDDAGSTRCLALSDRVLHTQPVRSAVAVQLLGIRQALPVQLLRTSSAVTAIVLAALNLVDGHTHLRTGEGVAVRTRVLRVLPGTISRTTEQILRITDLHSHDVGKALTDLLGQLRIQRRVVLLPDRVIEVKGTVDRCGIHRGAEVFAEHRVPPRSARVGVTALIFFRRAGVLKTKIIELLHGILAFIRRECHRRPHLDLHTCLGVRDRGSVSVTDRVAVSILLRTIVRNIIP